MIKNFVIYLVLVFFSTGLHAQELKVNIHNIRNDKGVIQLAFFVDNKSFKNEEPEFTRTVSKDMMNSNNSLEVVLTDIPPGKYGIALIDDENEDSEMNYNFVGVPQEGFGFSDYYASGFSKPDFEEFSFQFYDDKTIEIKIRHM